MDLTNKTITLGILTPLSGPVAAPIGIPLTKGMETYFKSVNANGGVDGFQIKLKEEDSKYDPATEVEDYNAIVGQVAMFAQSLGTPTTQAIVPLTHRDKVLVTVAGLDSYLAREPYMVLAGTPYRLQVENAFDYVVNQLHIANPKTAIIYQDDGYGQDGLTGYNESISYYPTGQRRRGHLRGHRHHRPAVCPSSGEDQGLRREICLPYRYPNGGSKHHRHGACSGLRSPVDSAEPRFLDPVDGRTRSESAACG